MQQTVSVSARLLAHRRDHDNNIGERGAEHIARALEKSSTITSIRLADRFLLLHADFVRGCHTGNCIGVGGTRYLARALEKSATITKIHLSGG